jgi:hypothetical protein
MIRRDLTVNDLGELSTVHVSGVDEGANAWVETDGFYWILEKSSGVPVGPGVIAPLPGSPIAGAPNARWIRQVTGGGSADPAAVLEIRFLIGTSPSQPSTTVLPAGAIVNSAQVEIVTPYSLGATIQVGQAPSPSLFQGVTDNNPQIANLYGAEQNTVVTANPVLVTVGGAPGVGSGFCVVRYVVVPKT